MVSEARADHRACAPGNLHRMLLDVSHATASHRDLKSLLCDLASLLRRVARFDRLAIVLHDPERDLMRLHTTILLLLVPVGGALLMGTPRRAGADPNKAN